MTDQWTDRLSEYLDGELLTGERTALEEHLVGCAACRATLSSRFGRNGGTSSRTFVVT